MGTASSALREFEDAAAVMAAEVFADGCLVERRIGDEVLRVIDIGERFDAVVPLHKAQQASYRKDRMGVELDPLRPPYGIFACTGMALSTASPLPS